MATTNQFKDYEKYRWFFTSSDKLVIGGKNSKQNEELIRYLIDEKCKYIVMHTKRPGSPFSIIISENANKEDLEETAIFTACFSKGWKEGRKKMLIDVFLLEQMTKTPKMKEGTFGVMDTIEHKPAFLKLYLTKQKNKLRAVPFEVKNAIAIMPGKTKKEVFAEQLAVKLDISTQEVIEALPTGDSDLTITIKAKNGNGKKKVTKKKVVKKTKSKKRVTKREVTKKPQVSKMKINKVAESVLKEVTKKPEVS